MASIISIKNNRSDFAARKDFCVPRAVFCCYKEKSVLFNFNFRIAFFFRNDIIYKAVFLFFKTCLIILNVLIFRR